MGQPLDEQLRIQARAYYVLDRKSIPEIARLLGIGDSTLRRWCRHERWDDNRRPRALSGRDIAQGLIEDIELIRKKAREEGRSLTHEDADAIIKLQATAEKLDPRARFRANALETMELLGRYTARHHPDLHTDLVPVLVEFSRRLVEQPIL